MAGTTNVLYPQVITFEEYNKIPEGFRFKIENHVKKLTSDLTLCTARLAASESDADQLVVSLQHEIGEGGLQIDYLSDQVIAFKTEIEEQQNKIRELTAAKEDVSKLVEKLEAQTVSLRNQRDIAVDERDNLLDTVQRYAAEKERMQLEYRTVEANLQTAVQAKCSAVLKLQDVESLQTSLEYKSRRLEDEKKLLATEREGYAQQVQILTSELLGIHSQNTNKRLLLETQLAEKIEELKSANHTIEDQYKTIEDLKNKVEDSLRKLMAAHENETKLENAFREETAQREKLLNIQTAMRDEAEAKCSTLEIGLSELRALLQDSMKEVQEGEKSRKLMQDTYEKELEEKLRHIASLEDDLKCSNDLIEGIKRDSLDNTMEGISPGAAAVSRALRAGTSLAQVYSQWANACEELMLEKAENKRLNDCILTIVQEVEAKAPEVKRIKEEFKGNLSDLANMSDSLQNYAQEHINFLNLISDLRKEKEHLEKQYQHRETEIQDLSRQVCHLLAERANVSSPQILEQGIKTVPDSPITSSQIISDHLVAFSNIKELQENNIKLLALVREFSEKAEGQENGNISELKVIIEARDKELAEIKYKFHELGKMMKRAMSQLEGFKNVMISRKSEQDSTTVTAGDGSASESSTAELRVQVKELQEKLQASEKALTETKEEFQTYRDDRGTNEALIVQELNRGRDELMELRMNSRKMLSQIEYGEERFQIVQTNCNTYKSQISALETKSKAYSNAVAKYETTLEKMQSDLFECQKKLARAEMLVDNLRRECSVLRESEARYTKEKECLKSQQQCQTLLMANLDIICAKLQHADEGTRLKLENRLDELLRENSGLRRNIQEEQERSRQVIANLQGEVQKAKKRCEEEKQMVALGREEKDSLKEELKNAKTEIDNLMKQIQKPSALLEAEKKVKTLEVELKHLEAELKKTQEHLELEKTHSKQFCSVSEVLECKLNETLSNFEEYREASERRTANALEKEEDLNKKISLLENNLSSLESGSTQSSAKLNTELKNTQEELQCVQKEFDKAKQELASAKMELITLRTSVQLAEEKYANEVCLHSADIKSLLEVKAEFNELSKKLDDLETAKVTAEGSLQAGRESWEERETMMQHELQEMQQHVGELESQNEILLQQFEALGTKLSYLENQGYVPSATSSLVKSSADVDEISNISLNTSLSEEGISTNDQLLHVIKFLRKEKLIAINKYEILKAENVRMKSQLEYVQTQLSQTQKSLDDERAKAAAAAVSANQHMEVLRRMDTLTAVADSNRILRGERDGLLAQVKEFELRVEDLVKELGPLREKNLELSARCDTMDAENAALRGEAARLRQRVNFLIERSSKTSPEDWRRLQQEREALARQVSTDREGLQRKDDEIRVLRQEKARLEEQVSNLTKQIQQKGEDLKRQADDINTVQQRLSKLTYELNDAKSMANKKNEELAKITEELGAKEALLSGAKNKEMQIRKIAKKYKTQWEELNMTSEQDKRKIEDMERAMADAQAAGSSTARSGEITPEAQEQLREEGRREVEMQIAETETRHNDKIKEVVEEAESLRKENDALKMSALDKEERAKILLKQARGKIAQLQESYNNSVDKVKNLEARLKSTDQGTEESVRMSALKTQYENRIARLEKECAELRSERQQKLDCLQRISVLERQLEKYQLQGFQFQSAWTSRGDAPSASIRPMAVSRTVAVLPVSIPGPCSTLSSPTTVLVPPQQQQAHTTASAGSGSAEFLSSSASSHSELVAISIGSTPIRQVAVSPCAREEPSQSVQSVVGSPQVLPSETVAPVSSVQDQQQLPLTQQQLQQPEHRTPEIEQSGQQQSFVESSQQQSQSRQQQQSQHPPQQQQALPQSQLQQQQPQVQQSQTQQQQPQQLQPQSPLTQQAQVQAHQLVPQQSLPQLQPPTGAPSPQQAQAVAMVLPRVDQQAAVGSVQQQQVEQHAGSPSNQTSISCSTLTASLAGSAAKRPRDSDNETGSDDGKPQGKRACVGGNQQNVVPAPSESEMDMDGYLASTSSKRDQDNEAVGSDDEGMPEEVVIEEPEDGPEFEEDADNADGYAVGPFRDEPDMTSFEEVEGPDMDDENQQDTDNNDAEIMDDNEVPNQSGTGSPVTQTSITPQPPATQPQTDASSSGSASFSGSKEVATASTGVGRGRRASSGVGFSRGPTRTVPPLTRQQQQQSQLLGYEESGDDSIVPSTPTLFVPRRSDGFGEAVSSPQVPQTRFTFSDTSTSATRGSTSQGPSETIELNQLEEAGTGRSVPTTPPQVSPQESVEVGQSEGDSGGEAVIPQNEEQPETSGSQTTVPSITVTEAPDNEATETIEEMPPPEPTEIDDPPEQRDSGEQSSEQSEGPEQADESGDGVSSEGEKPQATEEVEERREAETSETPEVQDEPRRVTRAANTARRSARGFRNQRGRGGMRPTPIVWNEPGPSMGSPSPRGRAAMMAAMRGNPPDQMRGNFPRGGQRNRRPRGKPKGNYSSPYQMRF